MKTPRKQTECQRLFDEEVQRLASEAFSAYFKSILRNLYVYGRKYEGSIMDGLCDLQIAAEPPTDKHELVISEHIPIEVGTAKLRAWLYEKLQATFLWTHCD